MKYSLKAIVAVVLLFSATLSANAQFDNNRVTKRFHFGIRGGFTVNSWSGDGVDVDALAFPTGGFAFDFQLAPVPVFLGFGVNYINEGFKYKKKDKTEDASAIHMPLVFGYHFNVAPNLFVSPYMGSFMSYCVDDDIPIIRDDQFNYGLRFGCGLNFGRLTFDMAYDLGLKNYGDDYYGDVDIHSRTFFITIGYNIAGER
jgi:hypothetical protein